EVYNEILLGGKNGVAQAVILALPLFIATAAALCWGLLHLGNVLPPLAAMLAEPRPLQLRWAKWPWFFFILGMLGLLAGVPLASLVWKTGLVGYPPQWSWPATTTRVGTMLRAETGLVWTSILTMFLSAAIITSFAVVLCWLAQDAPR